MKKNKLIKSILLALTIIFSMSLFTVLPTFADEDADSAASTTSSTDICNNRNIPDEIKAASGCGGSIAEPGTVIGNIVSTIVGILGLVAVIFILIGGVQYMTSTGDPGKTKKAKDTILYACIGLVVCVLAFAITQFTINAVNSASSGDGGSAEKTKTEEGPKDGPNKATKK